MVSYVLTYMLFETEESSIHGNNNGIGDLDPARWPNSHWRSVKVSWDESTAGEWQPRVSFWEIEPLTTFPMYPSFFPLRLKRPWYPGPSSFQVARIQRLASTRLVKIFSRRNHFGNLHVMVIANSMFFQPSISILFGNLDCVFPYTIIKVKMAGSWNRNTCYGCRKPSYHHRDVFYYQVVFMLSPVVVVELLFGLIDPKLPFVGPKIGEGAHAKVYEGKYKNKIVAIKLVNKGDTPEEIAKTEGRFAREVAM
ncbi:putative kinase-like domain superfamily, kinase, ATP binding protein [Helianthus annuus]|nr:putative kinase-like domain superfamily, kinase, ATP binding protein [Helianthus annuus]